MGGQGDTKLRALEALDAAIEAHEAARAKVLAVIARRRLEGEDAQGEEAERAALDVTIGNLEDERAEYRAAVVVVTAPTTAEIDEVLGSVERIRQLAVADAAAKTGRDTIREILTAALDLKNQNAKA